MTALDAPRVELKPTLPRMTVLAGGKGEQVISLVNLTIMPDDFIISVEGLPENWFTISKSDFNLFPNWSDSFTLGVEIADTVRPNLYIVRLIAASRNQPGIRTELRLEIDVLAPLNLQARLQPYRAVGFKANYSLIIRNRSMCQSTMTLQQKIEEQTNCVAQFTPPQLTLMPGMSHSVKVQVQLRPKTPKDQKRQLQHFDLMIQPQWIVGGMVMDTPPVDVEGEYSYRSRWEFLTRHPFLTINLVALLLIILFWSVLILPTIQNVLIFNTELITVEVKDRKLIRVEQKALSDTIQTRFNPLAAFTQIEATFSEANQDMQLRLRAFGFFDFYVQGQFEVTAETGDLILTKGKFGDFPWFFAPPNKVVEKLNIKIKQKLREIQGANVPLRMSRAVVEGNTLYILLENCKSNDRACL